MNVPLQTTIPGVLPARRRSRRPEGWRARLAAPLRWTARWCLRLADWINPLEN